MSELHEVFLQNVPFKFKRLPKEIEFRPVTIDDNAFFIQKFGAEKLSQLDKANNLSENLSALMFIICHLLTNESKIYLAQYEDDSLFKEYDEYGKPVENVLSIPAKIMKLAHESEFIPLLQTYIDIRTKSNEVPEQKEETGEEKKRVETPRKSHGRK